jgi:Pterin 4 alpha carbinolamine dehydratase
MVKAFTQEELAREFRALPSWRLENARLRRDFVFADFVEAFGFVTRVALLAERGSPPSVVKRIQAGDDPAFDARGVGHQRERYTPCR